MKRLVGTLWLVLGVGVLAWLSSPRPIAAAAPEPSIGAPQATEYLGPKDGCRKCHLKEYRSWQKTPHVKSLDVLSDSERQDPECLKCHTTGYGDPTGYKSEKETPQLAFVGCEVCHGPGSLYHEKATMKDKDAALAAGLKIPDEQTCLGCHNEESPNYPGSFEYEEMKAKGVHEIKPKS